MDTLVPIFGVMIPIVAIVGGIGYAIFSKWQEGEEQRQQTLAATDTHELHRRMQRIEEEVTMLHTEVGDDIRDLKEQMMRIEILLKEVE